ncbi:MAG: hypothetical protein AAFN10_24115 [Bacteroidota bacterium]
MFVLNDPEAPACLRVKLRAEALVYASRNASLFRPMQYAPLRLFSASQNDYQRSAKRGSLNHPARLARCPSLEMRGNNHFALLWS